MPFTTFESETVFEVWEFTDLGRRRIIEAVDHDDAVYYKQELEEAEAGSRRMAEDLHQEHIPRRFGIVLRTLSREVVE